VQINKRERGLTRRCSSSHDERVVVGSKASKGKSHQTIIRNGVPDESKQIDKRSEFLEKILARGTSFCQCLKLALQLGLSSDVYFAKLINTLI
jgi:hypothetical protein